MSKSGKYGKWLRGHNAVIKINDVLFLHAGLNTQWITLSLDRINADIRKALQTGRGRGGLLGSSGPMWYRGWASQHAAEVAAQCDPVFKKYGVKHAVIGHTPQRGITPLGNGRVLAIDTGMCAYYGGTPAALVIDKGGYHAVYPGRKPVALKVDYKPTAAKSQVNIQYPLRLRFRPAYTVYPAYGGSTEGGAGTFEPLCRNPNRSTHDNVRCDCPAGDAFVA